MNKIPINILLNPSHQENLKDKLQQINDKLTSLCSKIPGNTSGLEQEDHLELQRILLFLTTVVKNEKLDNDEIMLVRTTYQLSTTLSIMVKSLRMANENYESQTSKENSEEELTSPSSSDSNDRNEFVFNIVTQDMMNKKKMNIKSYRGHRLPKQNVKLLERWYIQNVENPYLDDKSISELMKITSLSKVQIKNWVSNRRRKEKSITISPEVSRLLQELKTEKA
ncbi:HML mating-type cassette alpha2 protein [Vanderwaltozyma polyspora DSM 70294]|uniref:HML mating-type cassette alpha2 protein n=1 Tax=Vanderwaltozyma polyspora (strain ATCC 22028 / DSM 70294 / BCRC 21397 / CBS 2163 / NBRC 10782 / NRRL Y-8283 / UCD 57-17) TaxID=436907 RepID=A7TFC1_VANPO|nr:HML mating-type cassette alpha2 protein [Vanderwaltozyma polyspora DSM 70294]EDO18935.1 HML mating-type cassette alpha2 protein [Vanderwaltozyma polyspora DSM 70294]